MTHADMRAILKGLQAKAAQDQVSQEVFDNVEEVLEALDELEEQEPRIRIPYVNASSLTTGTWK